MGYHTDFEGRFQLDKPLASEHAAYLRKFADTRRMRRNVDVVERFPDPVRIAVGLPVGVEGGDYVGADGFKGQHTDASVLDQNREPTDQPELWCHWTPSDDNTGIEWNGSEKFAQYVEWLRYLNEHFLKPWGYSLSGSVTWQGQAKYDSGTLSVIDGKVLAKADEHVGEEADSESRTR